ncbi:hypothetical protein ACK8P5_26260 (plasmid) [Paenibacillus sp. EC2-1]|uniref:hypothetical protein n=1 Tax=Paenibacillus sp. EC2-1 TaxID=3388665 RepID=UPI003BEF22DE
MDKKAVLKKIMDAQNKKAGSVVVGFGNEVANPLEFLPTPSEEFNAIVGGGIPRRRISEIFGPQSSGKTSLMEEMIGEDMQADPDAFWLWGETEDTFDLEYAQKVHGIDPERLILIEQSEDGGEALIDLMEPYLRSGVIKGFVVNSVAGLAPKKELETDMAKDNIALQARMMSKLMRKWTAIINKKGLYAVFINQVRTNVGQMFGDPNVTTGGRALSFFSSLRVGLSKLQLNEQDPITVDDGMKVGVRVAKNRCVYDNPYKKGEYLVIYGIGVDKLSEIIDKSPEANIGVRKSGSWFYIEDASGDVISAPKAVVDGEEVTDVPLKFQGKTKFRDFLNQNEWLANDLRDKLRDAVKTGEIVAKSQDEDEMKEIEKLEKLQAKIDAQEKARLEKAQQKKKEKKDKKDVTPEKTKKKKETA